MAVSSSGCVSNAVGPFKPAESTEVAKLGDSLLEAAPPFAGTLIRASRGGALFRTRHHELLIAGFVATVVAVAVASFWTPGAMGLVGGLTVAAAGLLRMVNERFLHKTMDRAPPVGSLKGLPAGRRASLRGTILSEGTFSSAYSRRPVVLVRYVGSVVRHSGRVLDGVGRPFQQLRGTGSFILQTDGGERVRIETRQSYLVAPLSWIRTETGDGASMSSATIETPRGLVTGMIHHEFGVGPGDRVDVLGVVDEEVDPAGVRSGPRGALTMPILRAGGLFPLLVREVYD
jgi:hypothetical protein